MSALARIATEFDDQALAERMVRGDSEAGAAFVERYYDDVYRFLRHLTRHVQESEDLAQHTLLRATRGIHRYDGSASLRTWVHRIAYREFLKWRRGRRFWLTLDPRQASQDTSIERFLDADQLVEALARLSPKLSATFLLVEVQELSLDEAASALKIPVGTVKSRLHDARQRLRQLLCEDQPEWTNGERAYENR